MLQLMWAGKHRAFRQVVVWALAGGALILFSAGFSTSWAQGNGARPDFRNVPGDVVLDLTSATDWRWIWFQLRGITTEPISAGTQTVKDAYCATRRPGDWAAGESEAEGVLCVAAPWLWIDSVVDALCHDAFDRVLLRREGSKIVCGQKEKSI